MTRASDFWVSVPLTDTAACNPNGYSCSVNRRVELLKRLGDWTPPPALGVTPDAITDPMTIMLWGVTTDRVKEWARQQEGGTELTGAAASGAGMDVVAIEKFPPPQSNQDKAVLSSYT